MSTSILSYQLRLHAIVLIFGFTGILGQLIQLPSLLIVIYRTAIASLALLVFLWWKKSKSNATGMTKLKWLGTGCIVGLHWFFFFESIKLSTVSVALVSLSSTALFTSILNPIFKKTKLAWFELVFGVFIIIGMSLVLRFEFQYVEGIFFGIICAFLASLFTVLNSQFVTKNDSNIISVYELTGGCIFILLISLFSDSSQLMIIPTIEDIFYLLLLGVVATAVAFVVSIQVMKQLTPFTVSLTINLEPLYGIILALLIFGSEEVMSAGFYLGFALILSTILINAWIKKRMRKAQFNIK